MDYLLISKMDEYYQWQNELLIESFLHKNLESKLKLSFFANVLSPNLPYLSNSIDKGITIYDMPDFGYENGYHKANIFFSIRNLLSNNCLNSSFALMESDMVIHEELPKNLETDFSSIFFSCNLDFDYKVFLNDIPNFLQIFDVSEDFLSKNWIYMGGLIVFTKLNVDFFESLMHHVAWVSSLQFKLNGKVHEKTYKIMLVVLLMKNKSNFYINYIDNGETHMRDNEKNFYFIHYHNGFPPFFHKYMFKNSMLSYGDPFDVMRINPSTYASWYMHELSGSYLKKIGRKLAPVILV